VVRAADTGDERITEETHPDLARTHICIVPGHEALAMRRRFVSCRSAYGSVTAEAVYLAATRRQRVVQCASTRDMARTIAYARTTGMRAVPRGGGHCFAGRSSTEELLLDLGRLRAIEVNADGRARIGAGARLAQVYDTLHRHARTIPASCGATVCIAGRTLAGGLGMLGRVYGLTCDALVGAQVVLADGRLVECDTEREPELFWALRGAGGGQFGVVTEFVFATVAEPRATRFELCWPDAAAAGSSTRGSTGRRSPWTTSPPT